MRCPRCGNDNPELNRFCGMCAATLLPAAGVAPAPPAAPVRSQVPARASRPASAAVQPAQRMPDSPSNYPEPDSQPYISGPSFLGLNQPGPARGTSFSGRSSQTETSSSSLDYLLEEEEEAKGGAGKFVLLLIAVALAAGLGYLRWRGQGLDWLTSGFKKSPITQEDTSQPPANAADNSASAQSPAAQSPSAQAVPSKPPTQPPSTNAAPSPQPDTPTQSAGGVIPVDSDAERQPAPKAADVNPETKSASAPPASPGENGKETSPPAVGTKKNAPGQVNGNTDIADTENSNDETSLPVSSPALSKPHAAKPMDTVAEAEKYIYGRGVSQDCDRGLKMLRPAANQANPKAMISLGALYSAGLCAPHDLPTAYRWFAMALRKEPENNFVQTDLKKLWSEMTPPERQLAIKLSQ